VEFSLDHDHSENGWYVDEDLAVDLRGWSGNQMTHILFDETVKPLVLAAIRQNIDDVMDSDPIRYRHRDEIAAELERGRKKWEVQ
jgi:hypothetical protein